MSSTGFWKKNPFGAIRAMTPRPRILGMAKNTTNGGEAAERRDVRYPCYSLKSAMRVADAVKDLGGSKSAVARSLLVKKLGMKDTGTFSQLLTAAKASASSMARRSTP